MKRIIQTVGTLTLLLSALNLSAAEAENTAEEILFGSKPALADDTMTFGCALPHHLEPRVARRSMSLFLPS